MIPHVAQNASSIQDYLLAGGRGKQNTTLSVEFFELVDDVTHTGSTNIDKYIQTPMYTCICACLVAYNDMFFLYFRIQKDPIRPPCTSSLPFTIHHKVRQLPTAIGGQQKSTKHAEGSKEAQASRGGDQGDTHTQQQTQQQQGPTSVQGSEVDTKWFGVSQFHSKKKY